jgi:hypothetical protein
MMMPKSERGVSRQKGAARLAFKPSRKLLSVALRDRGIIVNAVDAESFRKRPIGANLYRDWRQSSGEKAWAQIEAEVGEVG